VAGVAVAACLLLTSPGCSSAPGRQDVVVLHVYDGAGHRLDWEQFRDLQANGAGEDGHNDALLDAGTLEVTATGPLYPDGAGVALDAPAGALLALAWPSPDGYSQLLLPVPPPGTYSFNLLAARQAVAALRALRDAHPDQPPAGTAVEASASAEADLARAEATADESAAAVAATRAYDAAVHAQVALLQQYGAGRAAALRRGVTLDELPDTATLERARAAVGDGGWVRLVLDPDTPLREYAAPVAAAHRLGLRVLALPVDSSEMADLDDAAWRSRVTDAVAALPDVDEWEAGNEVNGDWLGEDVAARVAWAVDHVHEHTQASVLVTLYWQLGEGEAENSLFTWLAAHPEAVARADDVGLSVYPEEHPLGAATDAVLTRLHAVLPGRTLLVSELGYGSADLQPVWWWGSRTDQTGAGRAAVASLYTLAPAAYPFIGGGPFWWYFAQDGGSGTPLQQALRAAWS
jgi:hypothetical protein